MSNDTILGIAAGAGWFAFICAALVGAARGQRIAELERENAAKDETIRWINGALQNVCSCADVTEAKP